MIAIPTSLRVLLLGTLVVPAALAQPANDGFAAPWILGGTSASTNGSSAQPANATKEMGEPNHAGLPGGRSVWFVWTAPTDGPTRISTAGSQFNTLLAVYTGSAVNALTQVATNDNAASQGNTSRVEFDAQEGATYRIAIDGRNNSGTGTSSGNYVLTILMLGSVSIVSPTNGSLSTLRQPIAILAQASTPNPPISQVDFFHGGNLIDSVAAEPFSTVLLYAPLGTNILSAVMRDGAGLAWTSAVASVLVLKPGVTIVSPLDGAAFVNTNPINVSAATLLSAGAMTNVEFFADEQKFGESATPPFSAVWSNVTSGVHLLTAVGWDDAGISHTSAPVFVAVAQTLLATNSIWKFLDNGSDQGTNWIAPEFDDSAWGSGPAQFGYGDGDEATVVSYGLDPNNKYTTTYFRHALAISSAASYTNVVLRVQRDDGAVVYLNGLEATRLNMPAGPIGYRTFAAANASDDGVGFVSANAPASLLVEGTNVVAVEIHQDSASSSDISFNLELLGVPIIPRNQPPLVNWLSPTNGQFFLGPASVLLEVEASDPDGSIAKVEFYVDGMLLGETTNSPFTFTWTSPTAGPHLLRVVATDGEGASTASPVVAIAVYDSAGTPLVYLTRPLEGGIFQGPANVTLSASALAPNGVTNVVFLANDLVIGEDSEGLFSMVWSNAAVGTNRLAALAYDALGISGTSSVVTITVTPPPDNTSGPVVFSVAPPPGGTISNLTSIDILFSEEVTGVDAADLLVNGAPAFGVSGAGSNYAFAVAQPAYGAVTVMWATNHGIADAGIPPLPFAATGPGTTWSYNLIDLTPPLVAAKAPPANAIVTNLSQVTVIFSEAVTGVEAGDLLVNGMPALALESATNTTYTFGFTPPYSGTVNVSWASAHGIADGAPTPNAFDATGPGATWSYTLDARAILVQSNAHWLFVKGTAEASTPTNAWREAVFDDSSWSNSLAPFFYGDPYNTPGNPGTLLSDMQNRYSSVYLRKHFWVPNLSAITNLLLGAQSDDGFIAWINGVEVARYNVAAGEIPYTGVALTAVNEQNNTAVRIDHMLGDPSPYLVEGSNVLAVHAFNQSLGGSSDFGFNAQLYTYLADAGVAAPRLLAAEPAPGEVFYLTNIAVTFTEAVNGVDPGDLLVNGAPASGVSSSTNTIYAFSITQPPYGPVVVTWADNHGIADLDAPPKPFDAHAPGSTLAYTLLNPGRPTVASQLPVAGASITALTEITVIFNESVAGVEAGDLLVNGAPALTVNSDTNSTYIFGFAQPPYGPVLISWATNHGIQDLEMLEFDPTRPSSTWSYALLDPVPTVALVSPTNGAVFRTPVHVTLQAAAFDNDGLIARVEFFEGTNRLGEDTNGPFALTWRNVPAGGYTLLAVATDDSGLSVTSAPVSITVEPGPIGLVLSGSIWKYLDNGTDQSNAWREVTYDDSAWAAGPSELGYGDGGEATVVSFGPDSTNKYVTTYFRHTFQVTNAGEYTNLTLRLLRDDGAAVYLNGMEIARDGLPSGDLNYLTLALINVVGADEGRFFPRLIDPALLVQGTNVLAVEIHQVSTAANSADISFNLELIANLPPEPPTVALTRPANNALFQAPVNIALAAVASDNDGTVARVAFLVGTNQIAEVAVPPFNATWTNVAAGNYTLLAVAADSSGLMATSAPVSITVYPGPEPLVLAGSIWKYLDDGSNQSNAWRAVAFDDLTWPSGPAQLGYGESDEATTLSFGPDPQNKFITYYFRRAFMVADPGAFLSLTLDLIRADGAVVYLNGVEVHRHHLPPGPIDYRTLAMNGGPGAGTWFRTVLSPAALVSGVNVLAVEVHQDDPASPDLSFDLELAGVTSSLPLTLLRGPYLQIGTPTGGTVRWRTDLASDSIVFYGTDSTNLTAMAGDPVRTNEHIVTLTGLQPGATYYYAIGDSTRTLAGGPDYWFVTPPVAGTKKPTRLWVIGDSGTANQNARNVRDAYENFAAATRPADFWLMLGDNAYQNGTDAEHQAAVFDMYPVTLRNLFLWPTIGNHETAQSFTAVNFPYLDIFSLPQNGQAGGVPSGTERYYSFDYGNIHFVCLDSMTSTRSATSPMAQWLQDDLAATTADWIIVFFHHPPYTKGNHNSDGELELIELRENLLPILEANGVDLVLNGHSHNWERSFLLHGHYGLSGTLADSMKVDGGDGREGGTGAYRKNANGEGVVYTVAGNAGQITGGSLNHPAHFLSLNELGSMVIDIASNRLDAIFLATNGVVRDQFTLLKRGLDLPPAAPANLLAVAASSHEVTLWWVDPATNEGGFVVERSLDGTNFTPLLEVAADTSNASDTNVVVGVTYHYRVRAFNAAGPSDYSNLASTTVVGPSTPPQPPSNLVAASDNGTEAYRGTIILRWRDHATNEAGFLLERASDFSDFTPVATVAANVTHYVDRQLASASGYYYRVRSFNGGGSSIFSNVAGAETHPQSQVVFAGAIVTLHAGVEGTPPIRYQWHFEGLVIHAATNQTLTLENVQVWDEGQYYVAVADATGRTVSNPAWVFVVEPPLITAHPQSRTNLMGTIATFTVEVAGLEPFSFQWRRDGVPIPLATNQTLVLSNVQASAAGSYDVLVQNEFDTAASQAALLVINFPPVAGADTIYRFGTNGVIVEIAELLANDVDPDGEPIHLTELGPTTNQAATVELFGRYVRYLPPPNDEGDDAFSYRVSDERGAFGIGTVSVLFSDNTPPEAASIPDMLGSVLQPVTIVNLATDAASPAHRLRLSLEPGAPEGARVIATRGAFSWTPQRDQAASTNLIRLKVTDDGVPPLSAMTSFQVIVNDFVELTPGSTLVNAGETGRVSLQMDSSLGLSHLSFVLHYPGNLLTNLALEPLAPQLDSAALDIAGADTVALRFVAASGQTLQGTQMLARLHFQAVPAQSSSFVPLVIRDVSCPPTSRGLPPSTVLNSGEVTVIADAPLLRAMREADGRLTLVLFGKPGRSYWLEASATPVAADSWLPVRRVILSAPEQIVSDLEWADSKLFLRAREEQ